MLAIQNIADEISPWAIIIANLPHIPIVDPVITPATTRPIWPTEEYAINDFISDCRRQINLVTTAPIRASDIKKSFKDCDRLGNIMDIRIKPYPPNFRRIAARIIEPAIGASTCALGSHKWTENSGNFTINASNIKILVRVGFISAGVLIHG